MLSSTYPRGATDFQLIPRILLVDDLPENLRLLSEVFDTEKIETSFAKNGLRAVKLVEMSRFQIAILDINLPDLDGFEVAKRIRALQPDIEIIFCSAQNDRDSRERGALMGAIDFIEKPFDVALTRSRMKLHVDRLLLRQRIELEHHRMNAMFNSINDAVIWVNTEDQVVGWNQRATDLFKVDESEVIGRPFGLLLPDNAERRSLRDIYKTGSERQSIEMMDWSQNTFPVEIAVTEWVEPDGNLLAATITRLATVSSVASAEWVDMQRELEHLRAKATLLEQEVQRRTQELMQASRMASIGTLAAGVAHEINNPLAYVKSNLLSLNGYLKPLLTEINGLIEIHDSQSELVAPLKQAGLLRDPEELKFIRDDVADIITDLIDGSERIVTIVRGLRQFSHPASDKQELINLNDTVRTAYELVRNETKHNADIQFDLGEIPKVLASASEVTQVIVNLLVNASQSMGEQKGRIRVHSEADAQQVRISVEDSGSGIPPEELSRIFDPFFTTKPVGEGTGLGLAISQRIIQSHGGKIQVQSEVGQGTRFTLTFPVPD